MVVRVNAGQSMILEKDSLQLKKAVESTGLVCQM